MEKNKEIISQELNRELASTLDRYETILNYYKENSDRLNIYSEALNRNKTLIQGNIPSVLGLCNDYFNIRANFEKKYGVDLGQYNTSFDLDEKGNSKGIIFTLKEDKGLKVKSDLIQKLSSLWRDITLIKRDCEMLEKNFNFGGQK